MASRVGRDRSLKVFSTVFAVVLGLLLIILTYVAVSRSTELRSQASQLPDEQRTMVYKEWDFSSDVQGWTESENLRVTIENNALVAVVQPDDASPYPTIDASLGNVSDSIVLPAGEKTMTVNITLTNPSSDVKGASTQKCIARLSCITDGSCPTYVKFLPFFCGAATPTPSIAPEGLPYMTSAPTPTIAPAGLPYFPSEPTPTLPPGGLPYFPSEPILVSLTVHDRNGEVYETAGQEVSLGVGKRNTLIFPIGIETKTELVDLELHFSNLPYRTTIHINDIVVEGLAIASRNFPGDIQCIQQPCEVPDGLPYIKSPPRPTKTEEEKKIERRERREKENEKSTSTKGTEGTLQNTISN